MTQKNNKQDISIAETKKDIKYIIKVVDKLQKQVTNHLPHQIKELRAELIEHEKLDAKALANHEKADLKWKLTALGGIVVLLITSLIDTFIK